MNYHVAWLGYGGGWGDVAVGVNYHIAWLGYGGGWGDVNVGVNYHVAWLGYGGGWGDVNVGVNYHVAWLKVWQPSQKSAMLTNAFGSGLTAGSTNTTMAKTFGQLCHMS